jgi:hypothetical protein
MHLLTITEKKLYSRQSIFFEMFTLIQHILLDQEGDCTRRVLRAVEEICCGLGYLKFTLHHSLGIARTVTFRSEVIDGDTPSCWNISHIEEQWQTKKRERKGSKRRLKSE